MALSKREISGGLSLGSIGVLPRPGSGPKGCKSTRLDTRDFLIPQIIQNTLYPLQPRLQSVHVRFGRFICYFLAGDVACCAVGTSIGLIVVKSQRIFRRRPARRSARIEVRFVTVREDTDIRDSYVLHAGVSFEGAYQDNHEVKTLKVVAIT